MSKSKGRRTVVKAKAFLTERGWEVAECELSGRYRKNKDLFNLFDLVALQENAVPRFIQVKTNRPMKKELLENFSRKYDRLICMCMTWYDNDGWRLQTYHKGELFEEDLRRSKK